MFRRPAPIPPIGTLAVAADKPLAWGERVRYTAPCDVCGKAARWATQAKAAASESSVEHCPNCQQGAQ